VTGAFAAFTDTFTETTVLLDRKGRCAFAG
jgi:hypothetical protein